MIEEYDFEEIIKKYYLDNSIYGAHFKVAEEIFKDNIFFGVGIKNFRVESFSDKYDNIGHKLSVRRATTHPHQVQWFMNY